MSVPLTLALPGGVRAQLVIDLAVRLSRACPDWALWYTAEGYVLTPPGGNEALISTRVAFEAWLSRQERWSRERAPSVVQLHLFEEAA